MGVNPGAFDPYSGSTVYEYISKKWGGPTRTTPLQNLTIGITPTRICLNNPRRFEVAFFNVSVAPINFGFDSSITAGNGIVVPALGGSVQLTADEDGELVTYDLWAIAAQAGLQAWLYEVMRV